MLDDDLSGVLAGLDKLANDLKDFGTAGRAHLGVRGLLLNRAIILQGKIRDLRKNLAQKPLSDLWIQYGELRETGDQMYREFLEIVGGVAIRKDEIDEKICLIAQELVGGVVGNPPSLTILAIGDQRVPNLSRLMRIRFSDRAVWTLPLTAHQFAHLLIEDFEEFKSFARQTAEADLGEAPSQAEGDAELRLKRLAHNRSLEVAIIRWQQMIADCIALFIVGPCYAGSALLFRFSPVAACPETEGRAGALDIERAYVCLEMLRELNREANADSPYQDFIGWLEKLWTQAQADAANSDVITPARKALLDRFVTDLYRILGQNLPAAQYPSYQDQYTRGLGGWTIATQWAREWTQQGRNGGGGMKVPDDVGESSKVRDALNAAWLCRSKSEAAGDMRELAQVVRSVCDKIIAEAYKPTETDSSSAASQGPTRSRAR